mmetsp:Transcript_13484/g.16970  ORF Transcript_13484/g.16970 Transcript_13484/m.16970 type:complete len:459 (+) Transcript_13484:87-1463(+)
MPPYNPFFTITTLLSQNLPIENLTATIPTTIPLVTFDGNPSTTHEWSSLNDPVMGGKSTSTFAISSETHSGVFDGEVVDVPFLHAPGFVQAYTSFRNNNRFFNRFNKKAYSPFPDVRGCKALQLSVSLPDEEAYTGFKVSFGTAKSHKYNCGRHSYGYKAALPVEGGVSGVQKIVVPFDDFSDCNNDATGLPIVTCAEDEDVCPSDEALADLKTIAIWGEGVDGKFSLEIMSIDAVDCAVSVPSQELENDANGDGEIVLATFDGSDDATTRKWEQKNDPVMGGESTGTFTIENGLGHFVGEVVDVPFLQAPGFIKTATTDIHRPFPDVSHCDGMKILVRTNTDYDGYRFSFGIAHPPEGKMFAYGYKTDISLSVSDDFKIILLPFRSFTDYWDDATGNAIKTCDENERYCPGKVVLKNVKTVAFWGEGKNGKVDLEIKSVSAYGCGGVMQKERRHLRV